MELFGEKKNENKNANEVCHVNVNFFHFILKIDILFRGEIKVSHQATKRQLDMFFKARKVFFPIFLFIYYLDYISFVVG